MSFWIKKGADDCSGKFNKDNCNILHASHKWVKVKFSLKNLTNADHTCHPFLCFVSHLRCIDERDLVWAPGKPSRAIRAQREPQDTHTHTHSVSSTSCVFLLPKEAIKASLFPRQNPTLAKRARGKVGSLFKTHTPLPILALPPAFIFHIWRVCLVWYSDEVWSFF